MRFFLAVVLIVGVDLYAGRPSSADETNQPLQPQQEIERLQNLFREIVSQTEARLQQQADLVAAANAEAAQLREELAQAQEEIARLNSSLTEAETVRAEAEAVRAEAEAEKQVIIQVVESSRKDVARLNEELNAARAALSSSFSRATSFLELSTP